ncbi:hypothetical protein FGLOB1_1256 [Fusarium globosum]|uniref:Uncharacterized protein n=1 Tax=Fusarium globosum TaxID=78864 RepID=A0A8H6DJS9_9HYPO|nr:hypothetical protein FGLOB1_1256 [Fusarium globosum]
MSMDSSENQPESGGRTRVIVGLDFGTTNSGISYAVLAQDVKRPKSFSWRVGGSRQQKTPTKIEVSETIIEWFKLSLLHRDDLEKEILGSERFAKSNSDREKMNMTAKDATAQYPRNIWKGFLDELQAMVPNPHIQITITVPVLWPEYARKVIKEALYRANILNNNNVELAPKFVAEPEAAALAIFSAAYHLGDTPFSKVQPGQAVIVCDCGGGTTDTATYEISTVQPFRIKEVLPGQRILAGACSLDDGFINLLKEKVAQVISPKVFHNLKDEDFDYIVYNHWETYIKMSFGDNFPTMRIPLPFHWVGTQQRRMPVGQSVHIEFKHDEIASIFNPIVEKITSLIETEMRSAPTYLSKDVSYLIMTGGFSENRYLRHRISQTVNRVSPNTNILDYPNGQGVMQLECSVPGAVIHALQAHTNQKPVMVTSRIVRANWGVRESQGRSIFWLVITNESLAASAPNLRTVPAEALSVEDPASPDIFSIRVYCGQLQNEETRIREVCKLSWKTLDVGLSPDMKPVLKAPLQIEFIWDGAEMEFSLYYGGIKQSSMEIVHDWNV